MMIDIPIHNKGFVDINPIVAGWEKCKKGHSFGPHARDYYILHYVVSGKGVLFEGNKKHPVKEGEIFIIRPGEITTYTADDINPWYYIWIGFDGRLAKIFDEYSGCVAEYARNTFLDILEISADESMIEERLTAKVYEIIYNLFGGRKKEKRYEDIAYNHIKANYMKELRVDDIADMIGINRSYLSRLFKKKYGMPIQQFIVDIRLSHAAEFLRRGNGVSTSARLAGYEDVFNFSKMFKKKYKLSPSDFAKETG